MHDLHWKNRDHSDADLVTAAVETEDVYYGHEGMWTYYRTNYKNANCIQQLRQISKFWYAMGPGYGCHEPRQRIMSEMPFARLLVSQHISCGRQLLC